MRERILYYFLQSQKFIKPRWSLEASDYADSDYEASDN